MIPELLREHKDTIIEWLLRIGVAVAFIYPPVSAWFNPYAWVGYFPTFIIDASPLSELTLLHVFGAIEIVIGVWILFGKNIRIPSLAAAVSLLLIVAFNWSQMDVLFRDIAIALMALALALRHSEKGSL